MHFPPPLRFIPCATIILCICAYLYRAYFQRTDRSHIFIPKHIFLSKVHIIDSLYDERRYSNYILERFKTRKSPHFFSAPDIHFAEYTFHDSCRKCRCITLQSAISMKQENRKTYETTNIVIVILFNNIREARAERRKGDTRVTKIAMLYLCTHTSTYARTTIHELYTRLQSFAAVQIIYFVLTQLLHAYVLFEFYTSIHPTSQVAGNCLSTREQAYKTFIIPYYKSLINTRAFTSFTKYRREIFFPPFYFVIIEFAPVNFVPHIKYKY